MKTNSSFKIFKFSTLVPLGIAIAAILVTQPTRAGVINSIDFTESSSTTLMATYNGSTSGVTVDFLGHTRLGDVWKVTFPSAVSFNGIDRGVTAFWAEPEDSSEVNAGFFHPSSNVAFIFSEYAVGTNPTVPNGTTVTDLGRDTSNGGSIAVTFFDNGDVAAVPETGSTLGLVFLSLIPLFGLNRLRQVRSA